MIISGDSQERENWEKVEIRRCKNSRNFLEI